MRKILIEKTNTCIVTNTNNIEKMCEVLLESSKQYGLETTIYTIFGNNVIVKLPCSKFADYPIEELCLSNRGYNALKRCSANSIGNVVDLINSDKIYKVNSLGKKTINEIKMGILDYIYSSLEKPQKLIFFKNLICDNSDFECEVAV